MNFPNNSRKATEAIARLIEKSGADVDYLRVAKLIYLADRRSILDRGVPIFGGKYFSMVNGPMISEFSHFTNQRGVPPGWKALISPRRGNKMNITRHPVYENLSVYELEVLDQVVAEHFNRSTEDLIVWCHKNCPEYEEVASGRKPIEVETILRKAGKRKPHVEKVLALAQAAKDIDAAFA